MPLLGQPKVVHVSEQGRALGVFVVCDNGMGSSNGAVVPCFSMPGSWPPCHLGFLWDKLIGLVVEWFNILGVWKHRFGDCCPLGRVF